MNSAKSWSAVWYIHIGALGTFSWFVTPKRSCLLLELTHITTCASASLAPFESVHIPRHESIHKSVRTCPTNSARDATWRFHFGALIADSAPTISTSQRNARPNARHADHLHPHRWRSSWQFILSSRKTSRSLAILAGLVFVLSCIPPVTTNPTFNSNPPYEFSYFNWVKVESHRLIITLSLPIPLRNFSSAPKIQTQIQLPDVIFN